MRTRHFDRIPYQDRDIAILMKEAGLIVVRRHGRMIVDEQGSMLVAHVDGYTFRYYPMDPGDGTGMGSPPMPLEVGPAWPTTTHCLDIEGSELLFGLDFDIRGISPRRFVRGPWEYEIARAAGL